MISDTDDPSGSTGCDNPFDGEVPVPGAPHEDGIDPAQFAALLDSLVAEIKSSRGASFPDPADDDQARVLWTAVGVLMEADGSSLSAAITAIESAAAQLDVAAVDVAAYVTWNGRLPD